MLSYFHARSSDDDITFKRSRADVRLRRFIIF
jgi:hypothetical protein